MDSCRENSDLLHNRKELVSSGFPVSEGAGQSNEVNEAKLLNGVEGDGARDGGKETEVTSGVSLLPDSTTQSPDRPLSVKVTEAAVNGGRSEDESGVHTTSTQNDRHERSQNLEALLENPGSVPDEHLSGQLANEDTAAQSYESLPRVDSSSQIKPSLLDDAQSAEEGLERAFDANDEETSVNAEPLASSSVLEEDLPASKEQGSQETTVDVQVPTTSAEDVTEQNKVALESEEHTAVDDEEPKSTSCVQDKIPEDASIPGTSSSVDVKAAEASTSVDRTKAVPVKVNEIASISEAEDSKSVIETMEQSKVALKSKEPQNDSSCVQNEKPLDDSIPETSFLDDNDNNEEKADEASFVSADETVCSESVPMDVNEISAHSEMSCYESATEPMDVSQSNERVSSLGDDLDQSNHNSEQKLNKSESQPSADYESISSDDEGKVCSTEKDIMAPSDVKAAHKSDELGNDASNVDNKVEQAVNGVGMTPDNIVTDILNECLPHVEKGSASESNESEAFSMDHDGHSSGKQPKDAELEAEDIVADILNKSLQQVEQLISLETTELTDSPYKNGESALDDSVDATDESMEVAAEDERVEDIVASILKKCVRDAYNQSPSNICSDILLGLIPKVIKRHAHKKSIATKREKLKRSLENECALLSNSNYNCYDQKPVSVDTVDVVAMDSLAGLFASQIEDLIDKNLASENRPDACLTFMVSSSGLSLRRTLLEAELNLPIGKSRNLRLECLLCGSRFDIHSKCQRHLMTAHNLLPEVLYTCDICSYDSLDKTTYVQHLIETSHRRKLGLKALIYGDEECMEISEVQLQEDTAVVKEVLNDMVTEVVNSRPSVIVASMLDDLVEESINQSPSEVVSAIFSDLIEDSISQSPSEVVSAILSDLIEDSIHQSPSEICSVVLNSLVDSIAQEEDEEKEMLVDPFSSPSHIQIAVLANVVYTAKQLRKISCLNLKIKLMDLLKAESNKGNKLTFTATNAGITLGRSAGPPKQHPLPVKRDIAAGRWQCKLCSQSQNSKTRLLKHLLVYHKYERDVIYKCDACKVDLLDINCFGHHVYTKSHVEAVARCTTGQTDSSMLWQHDAREVQGVPDRELLRRYHVRPSIVRVVRLEDVRAGEHLSGRPKPALFVRRFICAPCNSSFQAAYQLKDHMQSTSHKDAALRNPGLLYHCPVCKVTLQSKKSIFYHFDSHSHRAALKAQRQGQNPKTQESSSIKTEIKQEPRVSSLAGKVNIPKRPLLTCKVCRAQFRSSVQYSQHMAQSHPRTAKTSERAPLQQRQKTSGFHCDICCKSFPSALRIKLHYMSLPHKEELMKKHGHQEFVKCQLCNLNFNLNRFVIHQQSSKHLQVMIANHASKPSKCKHCGKGFRDKWYVSRHQEICKSRRSEVSETVVRVKETKKEPAVEQKKTAAQAQSQSSPGSHYCTTCKLYFSSLRSLSIHVKDSKIHKINVKKTRIGSLTPITNNRVSRPESHTCICKKKFNSWKALRSHKAHCTISREKKINSEVTTKNVFVKLKDISPARPKAPESQKTAPSSGYYCETCIINFGHHADFVAHIKSEMHRRRLGSKRGRSPSPDVTIVADKPPAAKKPKINNAHSQQKKHTYHGIKCDVCNLNFGSLAQLKSHKKKNSHKANVRAAVKVEEKGSKKGIRETEDIGPRQSARETEKRGSTQLEMKAAEGSQAICMSFFEYDEKAKKYYCKLCKSHIDRKPSSHKKSSRRHKTLEREAYKQIRADKKIKENSVAVLTASANAVDKGRATRSSPEKRPGPVVKPAVSFACSICSKSFASSAEQNAHFASQEHVQELLKKTMPYCDVCKMAFGTSAELEQHKSTGEHQTAVREQEKKKPESTPVQKEAPKASAEQLVESSVTNLRCDVCNRSFNYLYGLKSHLRSKGHKEQVLESEKLRPSKEERRQETPVQKSVERKDELSLSCKICDRIFTNATYMDKHMKSKGHHDKVREAEAEKSPEPLMKGSAEESAVPKAAEPVVDLTCQTCEMTFRNEAGRNLHMRSKAHHRAVKEKETRPPATQSVQLEKQPKKYEWECTICDCSFRNHITYFNHLKSTFHTERERQGKEDKQSWECAVCDRSFRIQFAYIQHTKSAGHLEKQRRVNKQDEAPSSISRGKKRPGGRIEPPKAKKAPPAAPSVPTAPLPPQDDVILLDSDDDGGIVSIKQEKVDSTQPDFPVLSQPASSNEPNLDGLVGLCVDFPKGQKSAKGRSSKKNKAEVRPTLQVPPAPPANNPCYPVAMYPAIWTPAAPQANQSLSISLVDSTVRQHTISPEVSSISSVTPLSSSPAVTTSSMVAKTNATSTSSSSSSNSDANKNILYGCPNCSQKFRSINAYKTHYKSVHCNK